MQGDMKHFKYHAFLTPHLIITSFLSPANNIQQTRLYKIDVKHFNLAGSNEIVIDLFPSQTSDSIFN